MRVNMWAWLVIAGLALGEQALAVQLTCESQGMTRQECPMEWPGEVRLIEQLSRSTCERGRSWGAEPDHVWVDLGCRAIFEVLDSLPPDTAAASSNAFPIGLPRRVSCESRNQQRSDCEMDTRGEVRLVRRLSNARCEYGESWGLFRHTVWVDRGCRAVFESSGTDYDHQPNKLPGWAVRACNSVDRAHGRVVDWTNPKPGTYDLLVEFDTGRTECQVEAGGRVTKFEPTGN